MVLQLTFLFHNTCTKSMIKHFQHTVKLVLFPLNISLKIHFSLSLTFKKQLLYLIKKKIAKRNRLNNWLFCRSTVSALFLYCSQIQGPLVAITGLDYWLLPNYRKKECTYCRPTGVRVCKNISLVRAIISHVKSLNFNSLHLCIWYFLWG